MIRDLNTSFSVDQSTEAVFNAVNNVRGWWSERIDGVTDRIDQEFTYQRKDVHKCTVKIVEFLPGKKVVWLVLDNYFNFTQNQSEWKGTRVEFEISEAGGKTVLNFTHRGLVPEHECYNICFDAWTFYINESLKGLITKGVGQPNPLTE
ncbi:SRPBCC domain-containing protein [Dyadobacter sp. CY261]|uniref:SRPBCC domain-containing protein n=1 Tax=Dyadobacter sp. CY261 TaxID=2907203 RepID=UPI001F2F324B|nr:SRPBCC domain-containing protein [Dyadobacter sp. CY261]MCF0074241.1 SRPBCC domain-containing protein [Dyadobacter sp. CY261]